jgi:hypothetical protein
MNFSSDDPVLTDGFHWARAQALAYVFQADPVGSWYEAALPGRAAFCMRDVSHQATGAHFLGLAHHTYNMLHRFAENIAAERDWCTFWEIDRHNLPCPADYRDDRTFWYNLPANFDVLDCCLRQYHWTGNPGYLSDPAFRFFYNKSVNDYVRLWDKDGDGLLEHYPEYGFRGIATYNEQIADPLMGSDLVAAQFAAYCAYAEMLALEGRETDAEGFRTRANELRILYDETWWNENAGRYSSYRYQDGGFCSDFHGSTTLFCLYFGLIQNPERLRRTLDEVIDRVPSSNIEERSYLPEILYRYGRCEVAYREMKALFAPDLPRRDYPEVSFALIGALGSGLMGLSPQASERQITTLSGLTQATGWAEIANVRVFEASLTVRHDGRHATQLTLQNGRPLNWRAAFPGIHPALMVNGQPWPAQHSQGAAGQPESSVVLRVCPGETHRISIH